MVGWIEAGTDIAVEGVFKDGKKYVLFVNTQKDKNIAFSDLKITLDGTVLEEIYFDKNQKNYYLKPPYNDLDMQKIYTCTKAVEPASSGSSSSSGGDGSYIGTMSYTIITEATEGGSFDTPKVVTVASGKDQSFNISPLSDYVLIDVLVDGKSVGAKEKYTFTKVMANHTIKAIFAKADVISPFSDVSESDWFAKDVIYAYEKDLIKGMSKDKLDPRGKATRAQVAATIHRFDEMLTK